MSDKIGFDKLTYQGAEIEMTGGSPGVQVMVSRKELEQLNKENAELKRLIKWMFGIVGRWQNVEFLIHEQPDSPEKQSILKIVEGE